MVTVSMRRCDDGDIEVKNEDTGDTGLIVPAMSDGSVRLSSIRTVLDLEDEDPIEIRCRTSHHQTEKEGLG